MSTFHVTFHAGDLSRSRWEQFDALVDTGSSFSVAPRPLLEALGVQPVGKVPCTLADGSVVYSDIGEARTRIGDTDRVDLVIFGEQGEPSLLGAHTLEAHLLGVDPHNKRLIPINGLRMTSQLT